MTGDLVGLTLEQRVALGSGDGFWRTTPVDGIPALMVADGPHGVRSQVDSADEGGITAAPPATCFPPAVALAQTWDRELVERVGAAIGAEARALGVDVVLGPGVNLKRDPRCGRNFEYYSEDPLITGELAAAWVRGVQSRGVGTSLKHFAANNQEHDRMSVSADIDPRPLRELYLRAFERVVKTARPSTVMCSYNRLNGVLVSQNRWLLTTVLREEWGFDGVVMSDWGAVDDRPSAIAAGLDLEMPGTGGVTDAEAVAAVEAGELDAAAVDLAAGRVATLVRGIRARQRELPIEPVDVDAHHELAREAAARSIVLLKNEGVLPLARGARLAVIGPLALQPRLQGGGSSRVNPTRVDVPLDALAALAGSGAVSWAPGYASGTSAEEAAALRADAAHLASECDAAVVILGLGDEDEVEGRDRASLALPDGQEYLVAAVQERQPATAVVVVHGGVVDLGRLTETAPALVDAALLGQAGGSALADVLYGEVNPSGRLAETVPWRLEDVPAYATFPGEESRERYGEGVFVGYRWYDRRSLPVRFPFGHGLSYTEFEYRDLKADSVDGGIAVSVEVVNVGRLAGREIVQLYAGWPASRRVRPPRVLVGFAAVDLEPGEASCVELVVDRQDLAVWSTDDDDWFVEGGPLRLEVGASSRDLRLGAIVELVGDSRAGHLTPQSRLEEVLAVPEARRALGEHVAWLTGGPSEEAVGVGMETLMASLPVSRLVAFTSGAISREALAEILAAANRARADR